MGRRNKSLFAASWSHDQDGRHAHIWDWDVASGTSVHHSCSNDDPGLTLTYSTAMPNFVTEAFL